MNIDPVKINSNILKSASFMDETAAGKGYKKECEEALLQWDANKDGKTSVQEFAAHNVSLTDAVFSDNEELNQEARSILTFQMELYEAYAGDDGILSAEEYDACLQSEENGVLLDSWHDLKNQNAALHENLSEINLERYDLNNDGKTSAKEIYKAKLQNAEAIYGKNSAKYKEIKAEAKAEYKILKKGAEDKKDITAFDYANSIIAADVAKSNNFFGKLFGN